VWGLKRDLIFIQNNKDFYQTPKTKSNNKYIIINQVKKYLTALAWRRTIWWLLSVLFAYSKRKTTFRNRGRSLQIRLT
jgi:hypothetical protein